MQFRPWVTIFVLLITCLVSAYAQFNLPWKIFLALKIEYPLSEQFWSVITYGFVHGGAPHLILNMMALYSLGQHLEYFRGRIYFSLIYFVSIVVSGLAAMWIYSVFGTQARILVGASGGIFGLFGAFTYLILAKKGIPGSAKELKTNLLLNLVISFLPGISLTAHVAGFFTGAALAFVLEKIRTQKPSTFHQE